MRWRAYNAPPERLVRRVTLCASSSQAPYSSSRRKRQASSIPLLVLSKMQTLALVCILVL